MLYPASPELARRGRDYEEGIRKAIWRFDIVEARRLILEWDALVAVEAIKHRNESKPGMLCIPCDLDVSYMRDTRSVRIPHPACPRCGESQ